MTNNNENFYIYLYICINIYRYNSILCIYITISDFIGFLKNDINLI